MAEPHPDPAPNQSPASNKPESPDEKPNLEQRAAEDRDEGWGDRPRGGGLDDDWYLSERPPHHGG